LALLDIGNNYRSATDKRLCDLEVEPKLLAGFAQLDLQTILVDGQRSGEFRDFHAAAMTMAIRGALNGTVVEVVHNTDFDVLGYAEHLVTTFDIATRATPSSGRPTGRVGADPAARARERRHQSDSDRGDRQPR
jgi:hypothetical protein